MTSVYVNWGEGTIKLSWKQDFTPPRDLITSVHGFCFYNDKVLLVDLNDRGWDIPGGHIEEDETTEQCFKREAMEEGYIDGDCTLLGAIEVDHHENQKWNETSKYPIVGYQLFYRMDVKTIYPFEAEYEADRRMFVEPDEIKHYWKWSEIHQVILDYAMEINGKG
jgi:8-oxo-dGTP diphosphatase